MAWGSPKQGLPQVLMAEAIDLMLPFFLSCCTNLHYAVTKKQAICQNLLRLSPFVAFFFL